MERVRLVIAIAPDKLPLGSLGTLVEGTLDRPGMVRVIWDVGYNIPMYRSEIELAEPTTRH